MAMQVIKLRLPGHQLLPVQQRLCLQWPIDHQHNFCAKSGQRLQDAGLNTPTTHQTDLQSTTPNHKELQHVTQH
ncbi:hypothetical protein [Nitrincola sp. A-D6]|uniref:hypothetical protein n=1 Tax=Nitrincola sp. A-D6 TaxID=1545442 RepID=UPI001363AE41|nr:hypothetical protein [Nitrincola sp. A-D6]